MQQVFEKLLKRRVDSHKYDYGHVLVIGGSPGMVGAPFLSAMAALRCGAGLATIASQPAVVDKLERRVTEVMTLRLSDDVQELPAFLKERNVSVIAIGPGMKPDFAALILKSLESTALPLVIDGGGLAALQQNPDLIKPGMILTPHLGEFQRFFDEPLPKAADQLKYKMISFAHQNDVILVAKGHPTYIVDGDEIFEDNSGGPELATAGTGDVLTGMVSGIIAQKIEPLAAARAAVHLHGPAGQLAAKAKTEPGVIASDVIENIPAALKLVLQKEL